MADSRNPANDGFGGSRLLFAGERALADGFALIGFETLPDADPEALDALLTELLRERESAFLVLDHALAGCGSRLLARVNSDGGRIVVAEVPALNQPQALHIDLDAQIRVLLGGKPLDDGS